MRLHFEYDELGEWVFNGWEDGFLNVEDCLRIVLAACNNV